MKIQLSWLREFVDVKDSADAVAQTMSQRGFAVEGVERLSDGDAVLDFEVMGNRPDCMSMVGMAREIAAAYDLPGPKLDAFKRSPRTGAQKANKAGAQDDKGAGIDLRITIDNPDLCGRYVGAAAEVAIRPSPSWMQSRLQAAGIRPISNIVDVTNYVLLELGHPMHAFDYDKLHGGEIRVRTATPNERIRTLDGQDRSLTGDMLVIADADRPVAVAGVMGGADSEVSGTTTRIVFESAYFDPLSVRRTSKKLGLKTEASIRFERGADLTIADVALARALALTEMIGAGRASGAMLDRYPKRHTPATLTLRQDKIAGLLGAAVPDKDVRRILQQLGFELAPATGGWKVTVPARRVDVVREVDLIEEVARHYGFDRLPVTFPALTSAPPVVDPRIARSRQLRGVLTAAGFFEAVTFGFIAEGAAAPFAREGDLVPIANPLSETFAVLRPSMLPGLVDAVSHNRRREQRNVRLFEIGARFSRSAGERRAVACAWTGAGSSEHWSGTGRQVDFFDARAIVERICEAVGVPVRTAPAEEAWMAPGRRATVLAAADPVGVFGALHPSIADAHGLPGTDPVYVVELDLDALEQAAGARPTRVEPLPRFPSVTRDISILVDGTLAAEAVRTTIESAAPSTLVRVSEFDRYQGKGIPPDKISLSLHLTFRSSDRTLTDAEVQSAMDKVLAALKQQHGAVQR